MALRSICFFQLISNLSFVLDGSVDRVSASEAVDRGLIPSWVKFITLKLVFTAALLDPQR